MSVTYYQFESNSTDIAADGSTFTVNRGFNGVSGTLQSLLMRYTMVTTGPGYRTDASALFSSMRIVIDGQTYFNYSSGFGAQADAGQPGNLGYFINSIGGRSYQVPTAVDATTVDYYLEIPIGAVLSGNGVPRFEVTIGFYDCSDWIINGGGGSLSSGTMSYWGIYNSGTKTTTRVLQSTSFSHSANAIEQVVVRVGNVEQLYPGSTVAGVLVQNDSAADEYGTNGIRPLSLSQFGMPVDLHRWANGNLNNEIMAYLPAVAGQANVTSQLAFASTLGQLFVPLYNVAGGDCVLIVDSSATTVRTYTPVLVQSIGGREMSMARQTLTDSQGSANISKSILSRTE